MKIKSKYPGKEILMPFIKTIETELNVLLVSSVVFFCVLIFSNDIESVKCGQRGCGTLVGIVGGLAFSAMIFSIFSIVHKWKERL